MSVIKFVFETDAITWHKIDNPTGGMLFLNPKIYSIKIFLPEISPPDQKGIEHPYKYLI